VIIGRPADRLGRFEPHPAPVPALPQVAKHQLAVVTPEEEDRAAVPRAVPTVPDLPGPYRFYFYSFDCTEPQ
jgi:hypothetical protein